MEMFISGMTTMAYGAISLFFLRFWKKTEDKLFLFFAGAFAVLAIEKIIIAASTQPVELRPDIYVLRMFAFLLIAIAVIQKNRNQKC